MHGDRLDKEYERLKEENALVLEWGKSSNTMWDKKFGLKKWSSRLFYFSQNSTDIPANNRSKVTALFFLWIHYHNLKLKPIFNERKRVRAFFRRRCPLFVVGQFPFFSYLAEIISFFFPRVCIWSIRVDEMRATWGKIAPSIADFERGKKGRSVCPQVTLKDSLCHRKSISIVGSV